MVFNLRCRNRISLDIEYKDKWSEESFQIFYSAVAPEIRALPRSGTLDKLSFK